MKIKRIQRILRHKRVRKKVVGTNIVPRLVIFRSNRYIYAQLVDDVSSKTLASSSDLKLKSKDPIGKVQQAKNVGLTIAKLAQAKKIKKAVFDRAGYKYHGRVKALAEGAREGGLLF